MAKRKKTDIVGLKLRLRESLRAQIEAAAKAQDRSLNNEVVARLEQSFAKDVADRLRDDVLGVQEKMREELGQLAKKIELVIEVRGRQPVVHEFIAKTPDEEKRETGKQQSNNEEPELFTETPRQRGSKST